MVPPWNPSFLEGLSRSMLGSRRAKPGSARRPQLLLQREHA